jgi:PKD repeat protein
MTITFKSSYGQKEEKQEIEFTSKLTKSVDNGMNVLEFIEPSNNIQNRIEYNDSKVTIYAGPTTIDLEINKKIKNNFVTEHGTIIIISLLQELIIENEDVKLKYILTDEKDNLINNFEINLIVSN